MTMLIIGQGEEGTWTGVTQFLFPKIQENKQMISQKKPESQKCILVFTCSGARHASTYYLKSDLREGVVETVDVV